MNEKIGMYTEDEILEHLTEGEGRGFLGRSMYDAIFDKIHTLKTENEQLQQENHKYKEVIDKANKLIDKCIFPAYDEQSNDFQESLYKIKEVLKEAE